MGSEISVPAGTYVLAYNDTGTLQPYGAVVDGSQLKASYVPGSYPFGKSFKPGSKFKCRGYSQLRTTCLWECTLGIPPYSSSIGYQYPYTPLFLAKKSTLSVPNITKTAIEFNTTNTTITEDTMQWHSTSTNPSRVTPTVKGIYLATANGKMTGGTATQAYIEINKNGTTTLSSSQGDTITGASDLTYSCSCVINMNGTTDYLAMDVYQNTANPSETWSDMTFSVTLLRAT